MPVVVVALAADVAAVGMPAAVGRFGFIWTGLFIPGWRLRESNGTVEPVVAEPLVIEPATILTSLSFLNPNFVFARSTSYISNASVSVCGALLMLKAS